MLKVKEQKEKLENDSENDCRNQCLLNRFAH